MTEKMTAAEWTLAAQARAQAGKPLIVSVQRPEDGGLAAERKQAQTCVASPLDDHMVMAYCGPAGDVPSLMDAQLFATAPTLYRACLDTHRHLTRDGHTPTEDEDRLLALLTGALAMATASPAQDGEQ